MTNKHMDVSSLRDVVVGEYRKVGPEATLGVDGLDLPADVVGVDRGELRSDPMIQINPRCQEEKALDALIAGGALDPRTAWDQS